MKNYIMINPETREVTRRYQAECPDESVWLYRDPHAAHYEVPEDIDLAYAYVDENGTVRMDHERASEDAAARSEQAWADLRTRRDDLLYKCDWTQLDDAPLSDDDKTAWRTYRQALRDLPQNTSDPNDVTWPTPPS